MWYSSGLQQTIISHSMNQALVTGLSLAKLSREHKSYQNTMKFATKLN